MFIYKVSLTIIKMLTIVRKLEQYKTEPPILH